MKKMKVGSLIFAVLVLIAVGLFMFSGSVRIGYENEYITVKSGLSSLRFGGKAADGNNVVQSVELKSEFDLGRRIFGMETFKVLSGNFKNELFGDYQLYAYKDVHTYIVVHFTDGKVAVINQESDEKTKELYNTWEGMGTIET